VYYESPSLKLCFNLNYTRFMSVLLVWYNQLTLSGTIVAHSFIVALALGVVLEWQQDGLYGAGTLLGETSLGTG